MNAESLLSQIKSLELHLAILKAQAQQVQPPLPLKPAAELYGICAGTSQTSAEDIEAVKYRAPWPQDDPEAEQVRP